jgi:hypothetical protein
MYDKKLIALVILAVVFSIGHYADHVLRGDLPWPPTAASVPFIVISLATYTVIALGLYLYSKNKVGPRFWTMLSGAGLAFGWLAHFSPFTDQPPSHILSSYESRIAGWFALATLMALMIVLIVATLYAGHLWKNSVKGDR